MNTRQRHVALNVYSGMNQTQAYEAVYGPNPNSYTLASDLLRKPYMKAYLDSLNQRKEAVIVATSTLENRDLILTKNEKRTILAEIARASLKDFLKDGDPSLDDDTPNARAAREYTRRTRMDKDGNVISNKSIKLINPIEAIQEDNKMSGDYAPSKHMVAQNVQISVSFKRKGRNNGQESAD